MKTIRSVCAAVALSGVAATQAAILDNPLITLSAPAFNANFGAANIFNSTDQEYASQSRGFGPSLSTTQGTFLEFDFGQMVTIDRFVNVTRRNAVDVIFTERLIFSNDPIFDLADPFLDLSPAGSNGQGIIKSFAPQTARYVRWEVLDGALNGTGQNANNFGSVEMRFLRPSAGLVQLAPTVIGGAQAFSPVFDLPFAANGDAGRTGGAGSTGIEYASLSAGPNMFVDFDMGAIEPIAGFDFYDRFGFAGGNLVDRVNSFDLIFSNDPSFSSVISTLSFTPGPWGYHQQFAPVTARYVRFDATSTANPTSNSGIQEITFYTVPEPATGLLLLGGLVACVRRRRSA